MHLLKVPLEVLTSSCVITTKYTTTFSTHAVQMDLNGIVCIHSCLVRNEKTIFSGLEVAFTTFMDPLLVYRWTTPVSCILITFPAMALYLIFNSLVCMSHNVVMNLHIPLVTGLYSH